MKCFRHSQTDAVGTCKHCFKGVCAECANDTGIGLVCSSQCESEVRSMRMLVERNKLAFPLAAKTHGRNAILLALLGLAFVVGGVLERNDTFLFPWLLSMGVIFIVGAVFSLLMRRKYAKAPQTRA